jgi:flagellar motor switch protein FliG
MTTLDPLKKVAIFLLYLERYSLNAARKVFKELGEKRTKEVTDMMTSLGTVPSDSIKTIIEEMYSTCVDKKTILGGRNTSEKILKDTFGISDAPLSIDANSFSLDSIKSKSLYNFLENESDELCAFVFFHLKDVKLQELIQLFSTDRVQKIISLTINLKIDPTPLVQAFITEMKDTIESDFSQSSSETESKQIEKFSRALEGISDESSEEILKNLSKTDKKTVQRIKAHMFNIEDFENLAEEKIRKVIEGVESTKDLAILIKNGSKKFQKLMLSSMTERVRSIVEEDLEDLPKKVDKKKYKDACTKFFQSAKKNKITPTSV